MHRAFDTRWLSHADFAPVARHPGWRWWLLATAGGLLLVLAIAVPRIGFSLEERAAARHEQALLAAELERVTTQLALEGATRRELEGHAAELSTQVEELTRQVEFLAARRPAVARTSPPK